MKNGWHPNEALCNRNVPSRARVIGSWVTMSGECIDTIYELDGKYFMVGSWVWEKPQELSKEEIEELLKEERIG